jgi:hypothetical protein
MENAGNSMRSFGDILAQVDFVNLAVALVFGILLVGGLGAAWSGGLREELSTSQGKADEPVGPTHVPLAADDEDRKDGDEDDHERRHGDGEERWGESDEERDRGG